MLKAPASLTIYAHFSHFTFKAYVVDTHKGTTSVSGQNNDETTIKQISHFCNYLNSQSWRML